MYITNGGNKPKESVDQFLNKTKNKKCKNAIKQGNSLRVASAISGVSLGTASKINKLILEDST